MILKTSTRTVFAATFLTILLSLSACGSGSSTPPVPPATISSVSSTNPAVGKLTTFNITGANLPASLAPTITGCTGVTVLSSSSTSNRQFSCTPTQLNVGVSINYGASTPFVTNIAIPSITSVTAAGISYGKTITFLIIGENLPSSLSASAGACTNFTAIVSTSSTQREFTCTPDGINIPVSIDFGGAAPYSANISVPLPNVTFVTSLGSVVVELYPDKAPKSVKNFLNYVSSSFYNNTVFHRIVPGFVSQGGGFVADPVNKISQKANSTAPIALESNNGLSNSKYSLAMARMNAPDTATSQFYFNAANNTQLDFNAALITANGYAVFGKAISGTAVLDSINAVANATYAGYSNVPTTDLVLLSVTRTQ